MDNAQPPIVIFEPREGGHRAGFVRYLYQALSSSANHDQPFLFYVHPRIAETLIPETPGIRMASASPEPAASLLSQLNKVCAAYQPKEIMLMALGDLEWPLLLRPCPVPLSAILFVQYPEMRPGLKRCFKDKKTALLLRRNRIRRLFLLNGAHSAALLSRRFPGETRFLPLPDPVSPLPAGCRIHPPVKWSKTVFLYFGAISRRKGFGLLVETLMTLTPEELRRMKFVICGRPEDPVYFEVMCKRLERTGLPVQMDVVNRFLSEEEMYRRFLGADVVLMPYLRPDYSSGVLGIAARTQRPVIGPDQGLLGRLIREHALGQTCRMRVTDLRRALLAAAAKGVTFDAVSARRFAEASSPGEFARIVTEALVDGSLE